MRRMRCCLATVRSSTYVAGALLLGVRCEGPKLEKPSRSEVVGELQHLRVIPPELMMHAVGQPNSFFLQFLGKARPRTQFDEPWISNLEAAKQTSIRPYAVGQHIGVSAIVLGAGDTEPVA